MAKNSQEDSDLQPRNSNLLNGDSFEWSEWWPTIIGVGVGLPLLSLAIYNRVEVNQLKKETTPVPDSKANIDRLWKSIQAVKADQEMTKALINENEARMDNLSNRFENIPSVEALEKAGDRVQKLVEAAEETQQSIAKSSREVKTISERLDEKLQDPWYSVAAPVGSAVLWGLGTFVVSTPAFKMLFFRDLTGDRGWRKAAATGGVVATLTAVLAWYVSGGTKAFS